MADSTENICVVLFYYIFCTTSVEKNNIFDFDISTYEKVLNKISSNRFENEIKLINSIVNNDLTFVRNFDFSVFSSVYGKKDCKFFFIYFF